MPVQQVVPVVCPNCHTQFTAPIENIIDGQNPAMKMAFLQGQLNQVQCPRCSFVAMPATPILYYDLEKELALIFIPGGLSLAGPNQEKIIGDLTNRLVNNLPAAQRKFYLFNPRRFLSLESLAKAILEADGITEEMLNAQEARAKLLEEFLQATSEADLKEKIKSHDAQLNREFFDLLTAYMQNAQLSGDQNGAQTLFGLRMFIARWSSHGKQIVQEIDRELGLVVVQNQEELLEKMEAAKDNQELEALIAAGHALLDYTFFQKLTAKIDAATKTGDHKSAQTLRDLRNVILEVKAKQEEASKAALQQAANLLKEILQSSQPQKVISRKLEQIDEAFFYILSTNIQEARRQGQNQTAQALEMVGNIAMSQLQEHYGAEMAQQARQQGQTTSTPQPFTPPPVEKPKIHIASR